MKHKVLIVEDDELLREVYSMKFEKENYEVRGAVDGAEGVRIATDFKPEVILLDLLMPNMNGFEFLQQYRALPNADAKVIVFTNMETPDSIKKISELGGVEKYFVKSNTTPVIVYDYIKTLTDKTESIPSSP